MPTLDVVLARHQVVAVVTQPDRPAHRGQHVTMSPVKQRALAAGVPVIQPARLRDAGWPERLRELGAEVAVVVAFGQILPRAVLDVPPRGSINVHASVLPRHRGAAPIAWAIIRGERETGVTIMQMDEGLDTGPVLHVERTPIGPDETAGELAARLAALGARALGETLERLDTIAPVPQDHARATLAPRLTKTDGHIAWSRPAGELASLVRGCNPWPGALARVQARPLLIWRARATQDAAPPGPPRPGTLVSHGRSLAVATGDGLLLPVEVQAEGRRATSWEEYLRGARLAAGDVLAAP